MRWDHISTFLMLYSSSVSHTFQSIIQFTAFFPILLSCGTSAFTGGMNQKVLDTTIAGSGYRNLASRPLKVLWYLD